jgi:hypothetical protein
MKSLSPELVALFATSTGVGLMMIVAGVQTNALEWRRRRRSCPSCGRVIEARRCACTSP